MNDYNDSYAAHCNDDDKQSIRLLTIFYKDKIDKLLNELTSLKLYTDQLEKNIKRLSENQHIPVDMRKDYDSDKDLTLQVLDLQRWLVNINKIEDINVYLNCLGNPNVKTCDVMDNIYRLIRDLVRRDEVDAKVLNEIEKLTGEQK